MTTLSTDNRESLAYAALCLVCDRLLGAINGPAHATVEFATVGSTAVPIGVSVYAPLRRQVVQRLADLPPTFSLAFQHEGEAWILDRS